MHLVISDNIRAKMQSKHDVSPKDVRECFENRRGGFLEDDREQNKSDPPTLWFIAPNHHRRMLKVCFVLRDGKVFLRTCYPPNATEQMIYKCHGSEK